MTVARPHYRCLVHRTFNVAIAFVWLVNGLICKLLDLVPRHREIVARILGSEHAELLTRAIGASEIVMTVWILSGFRPRLCALAQMVVILAMNVLEFFLVPDLLSFGRMNLVFALLLIGVIGVNEFVLRSTVSGTASGVRLL